MYSVHTLCNPAVFHQTRHIVHTLKKIFRARLLWGNFKVYNGKLLFVHRNYTVLAIFPSVRKNLFWVLFCLHYSEKKKNLRLKSKFFQRSESTMCFVVKSIRISINSTLKSSRISFYIEFNFEATCIIA